MKRRRATSAEASKEALVLLGDLGVTKEIWRMLGRCVVVCLLLFPRFLIWRTIQDAAIAAVVMLCLLCLTGDRRTVFVVFFLRGRCAIVGGFAASGCKVALVAGFGPFASHASRRRDASTGWNLNAIAAATESVLGQTKRGGGRGSRTAVPMVRGGGSRCGFEAGRDKSSGRVSLRVGILVELELPLSLPRLYQENYIQSGTQMKEIERGKTLRSWLSLEKSGLSEGGR